MTPRTLYSRIALAEMITWALLIGSMVLKYTNVTDVATRIAGGIHGFTFLCFCVITVMLWVNNKWPAGRGVLGLLSSIIPFATLPFEKSTEAAGLLRGPWRFYGPAAETPKTFPERVLSLIVNRPILAAIIVIVGVTVVFLILLSLGNPVEWFKN
ncbi:DUF3817 domain-containing protein [Corynebacterium falsenii]|uniref:DUF3817 domain-containing protein n=1 Tax=Corynebacterium falsenii TaxID=108486 RepID=UPI00234C48B6|nr:DUF3817 domain-containing protein [Corynebacterium falsenii]MDC7103476.1 DUF3817 domain-containing protein [Corynebacterium falsenii]